jgi:hypothetical protein
MSQEELHKLTLSHTMIESDVSPHFTFVEILQLLNQTDYDEATKVIGKMVLAKHKLKT